MNAYKARGVGELNKHPCQSRESLFSSSPETGFLGSGSRWRIASRNACASHLLLQPPTLRYRPFGLQILLLS